MMNSRGAALKSTAKYTQVLIGVLAVVFVLDGCAALRTRRGTPERSGFLGDYSQVTKRAGYDAALLYINPDAQWANYDAIHLESVTLWASQQTGKLSAEEKQMLTDTLFAALHEELGKVFTLVDSPGPSVLRLRAALTQAKGANVPLRTVTTVVPQARAIGSVVGLAADTAMTVGSATVEMDLRDSITDERLAAVVDERTGTKALLTKRAYTTWGDVEEAARFWSKSATYQIARWGVQRQPGVPMPQQPKPSRSL